MRILVALVVVASCSGDKPKDIDADPNLCTKAVYDVCATEHDCATAMCHNFQMEGFQVCTQACTPGMDSTCPQPTGGSATCNTMGICKPSAANSCHL